MDRGKNELTFWNSIVANSVSILFISFFTKYSSHTVAWALVWNKLFQSLNIPENSNKIRGNSLPSIDLDSKQKEKQLVKIIHSSSKGNTFGKGNLCFFSSEISWKKALGDTFKSENHTCILYGPPLLALLGEATRFLLPVSEGNIDRRVRAGISRSSESW